MEGNGTETKYMLNSATCVQKRLSPLKKALQSQNMTLPRHTAMVQFISTRNTVQFSKDITFFLNNEEVKKIYLLFNQNSFQAIRRIKSRSNGELC